MRSRCCLCSAKTPEVSLHAFPKNIRMRNIWKQICCYEEHVDVSRLRICSNHFTVHNYIEPNAKTFGRTLKLKTRQFPTVDVPNTYIVTQQIIQRELVKIIEYEHDYDTSISKSMSGLQVNTDLFPFVEIGNTVHEFCEEEISTIEVETSPIEELFPKQQDDTIKKSRKRKSQSVSETDSSGEEKALSIEIIRNQTLKFKNKRLVKQIDLIERTLKHVIETNRIPKDVIDIMMNVLPDYMKKNILGNSKPEKKII